MCCYREIIWCQKKVLMFFSDNWTPSPLYHHPSGSVELILDCFVKYPLASLCWFFSPTKNTIHDYLAVSLGKNTYWTLTYEFPINFARWFCLFLFSICLTRYVYILNSRRGLSMFIISAVWVCVHHSYS